MFGLDVMHIQVSQSQVSAKPLLPVQHGVCYHNEVNVPVHWIIQVRASSVRQEGQIPRQITICRQEHVKHNTDVCWETSCRGCLRNQFAVRRATEYWEFDVDGIKFVVSAMK